MSVPCAPINSSGKKGCISSEINTVEVRAVAGFEPPTSVEYNRAVGVEQVVVNVDRGKHHLILLGETVSWNKSLMER